MPIYEYKCDNCGKHTEVLQKFSDPPISECDLCHGSMKKLISQSTFHLKGSGWYVTDYANKTTCSSESSSSPSKPKDTSDTTSKPKMETKGSSESTSNSDSLKNAK